MADDPIRDDGQIDGERVDPAKDEGTIIYLPTLIADEFGVSPDMARMQILNGMLRVDGKLWKGDSLYVHRDSLLGKLLEIKGRDRGFRMTYRGGTNDRFYPEG